MRLLGEHLGIEGVSIHLHWPLCVGVVNLGGVPAVQGTFRAGVLRLARAARTREGGERLTIRAVWEKGSISIGLNAASRPRPLWTWGLMLRSEVSLATFSKLSLPSRLAGRTVASRVPVVLSKAADV